MHKEQFLFFFFTSNDLCFRLLQQQSKEGRKRNIQGSLQNQHSSCFPCDELQNLPVIHWPPPARPAVHRKQDCYDDIQYVHTQPISLLPVLINEKTGWNELVHIHN